MSKRECNGHTRSATVSNRVNGEAARPAPADRDARGHFRPGCRPGPGNPFNRECARLRRELLAAADDAGAIRRIVEALVKRVEKTGDLGAATLLLRYTIGKPLADIPHPDLVDLNEYEMAARVPTTADAVRLDGLPPAFALAVLRGLQQTAAYLAVQQHLGLGSGVWQRIIEQGGDEAMAAWFQETVELERAAQQAQAKAAAAAAGKAARPGGRTD
jgi:hypothetical protein